MEFTHVIDTSHEDDDTSSKKEKKSSRKKTVPIVPVAVQMESTRMAERASREAEDDDKEKAKKKKRKKASLSGVLPLTVESADEKVASDGTAETTEASDDDELSEEKSPESAEATDTAPKNETAFMGELLVSDRARRIRELEHAKAVAEAEALAADAQNEEEAQQKLQAITEELTEIAEDAELSPDASAASAEAVADEGHEDEEELSEDDTTSPRTTAKPASSGAGSSGSGSGGRGTVPPPPIPPPYVPPPSRSSSNLPPVPVMNAGINGPSAPNILAATSAAAPEVVPDRQAERRSLLTGLLVGGVIEHIRHKRREHRMEKKHAEEIKQLSGEQQAAALKAIEAEKAASRRQPALEQQLTRLKQAEQTPSAANVMPSSERRTEPVRTSPARAEKAPEELAKTRAQLEQAWTLKQEEIEQKRDIPDDHRLETSAWHTIEVDKKTGKAVENPTVGYGEEFQFEQHQEQLRREIEETSLASENMRERYVDPHTQSSTPATLGYAGVQASQQQATTSNVSSPAATETSEEKKPRITAVDAVLWGILVIIIFIIFRVLSA